MKIHLVSDIDCNIVYLKCPIFFYEKWQNNMGCKFSDGDTTQAGYNEYWTRQIELVTLSTMFSVVQVQDSRQVVDHLLKHGIYIRLIQKISKNICPDTDLGT